MTDPIAGKIIDELLVLFNHHENDRGFLAVEEALEYVKDCASEHIEQPVTLSLAKMFDKQTPGWRRRKR